MAVVRTLTPTAEDPLAVALSEIPARVKAPPSCCYRGNCPCSFGCTPKWETVAQGAKPRVPPLARRALFSR